MNTSKSLLLVLEIPLEGTDISVPSSPIWSVHGTKGLYQGTGASHCIPKEAVDPDFRLFGGHTHCREHTPGGGVDHTDSYPNLDTDRLYYNPEESD